MQTRHIFNSLILLAAFLSLFSAPYQFSFFHFISNAWGASSGNGAAGEEPEEFYQYTDRDGVIHFADSIENIPQRYRDRLTVRKEKRTVRNMTEVSIVNAQIYVPVTFMNRDRTAQVNLILDTGASITCITGDLASRLGLDTANARVVSMGMADGSMIDIRVTKVDSLSVGVRSKSPFEIGILPRPATGGEHDGYLGLDFLGQFPHQIDFQNSRIRWQ